LFQTADAVNHGGEVSSTLIWAGIRYSLIPITMGFVSLHISAIGWFDVKRFKCEKKKL
jgi:hypothetical protein